MKKLIILLLAACTAMFSHATDYYLKTTYSSTPQSVLSWATNPDGTGTEPLNFSTPGDVFHVGPSQSILLGTTWNVSGITLDMAGTFNITTGGHLNGTNSTLGGTGNVEIAGNNTCVMNMETPSTVTFTTATSISGGSYYNLVLSPGSATAYTAAGNITAAYFDAGWYHVQSVDMLSYKLEVTYILSLPGTLRTANTSAAPIPSGATWGIVEYTNAAGGQTIVSGTYDYLTLQNTSGTQTASGDLNVTQELYTYSGGTMEMGLYALSALGVNHNGTLRTANTSSAPIPESQSWSGVVQFTADNGGQTIPGGFYHTLQSQNTSGINAASGTLNISTTFTQSTGTLSMGAYALVVTSASIFNGGTIQTACTMIQPISSSRTWPGTIEFNNAAGGQRIPAGTYSRLTLSNTSGTNTAIGSLSVSTAITLSTGTLDMGSYNLSGNFLVGNTGRIKTAGSMPTGKSWNGTVEFNRAAGGQNVPAGTYVHLAVTNSSGTITAVGAITVSASITIGTGTFSLGTNVLSGAFTTVTGQGTISTANLSGGIPINKTWDGTVLYTAAGQSIRAGTYKNLTVGGTSGTSTAGGNLVVNGVLTQSAVSANFSMAAYTLSGTMTSATITGNLTTTNASAAPLPTGVTWGGSGTVLFQGTAGQSVPAGTYQKLSCSTTQTLTATGNLVVQSSLVIGTNTTLNLSIYTLGGSLTSIFLSGILRTANTSSLPFPSGRTWNGTVNLNGTNQTLPGGTYSTLSIAGTTVTAGGTVEATNFTTSASVVLDMGSNNLNVTGTLTHGGILVSAGTIPSGKNWGGIVRFNSAGSQTVPNGNFYDLDISGGDRLMGTDVGITGSFTPGSGTIDMSATHIRHYGNSIITLPPTSLFAISIYDNGTILLSSTTTLSGHLYFTGAGSMVLNGYDLTVGSIIGAVNANGYVILGNNSLTVKNIPVGVTTSIPIGQSASSMSAIKLNPTNMVDWTFSMLSTVSVPQPQQAVQRTWNITPSATPGPTDISFHYSNIDPTVFSSASGAWTGSGNVKIGHYNSTTSAWELAGTYSPTTDINNWVAVLSGWTSFSPFSISSINSTLPVRYSSFTGKQTPNGNLLKWTTSFEQNNAGFRVERSSNGIAYTKIGSVQGTNLANGSSYSFTDAQPAGNTQYYRLVQQDLDGREHTSNVIILKATAGNLLKMGAAYPNPVHEFLQVPVQASRSEAVEMRVTDIAGRQLFTMSVEVHTGMQIIRIPTANLTPGTYFLEVKGSVVTERVRFVKQ